MNLEKLKELAKDLPETVRANAEALVERMGEVIEGIGDKPVEWRAGVLRLIQATSDRSKLPKGTNIGDLMIGENVLKQPYPVFPMRTWNARQMWSPDQNEAKMLCSSPDAVLGYIGVECKNCPHSKFDEETKKTDCNKIKQVMVVAADLSDVFIVNFAKTSYKTGTDWEMMMKKAGVAPYRRAYGVSSKTSTQYKNVETIVVEPMAGEQRAAPDALIPFLTELFNQIGEDRKEAVSEFHTMIKSRKQDQNLLTNSNADSDVVLLSNDVQDVDSTPVAQETKVSPLAKKYDM